MKSTRHAVSRIIAAEYKMGNKSSVGYTRLLNRALICEQLEFVDGILLYYKGLLLYKYSKISFETRTGEKKRENYALLCSGLSP